MDDVLTFLMPWITGTFLPWAVNVVATYPGTTAALVVIFVLGQIMAAAGRLRYPDYKDRPEFWKWVVILADVMTISPSNLIKYFKKDPNPPLVVRRDT